MLAVIDKTPICFDGNGYKLAPANVTTVVIHRLSLAFKAEENPYPISDDQLDGPAVANTFKNKKMGTGGRCPYHFLIRKDLDATVEQMLPLGIMGTHALSKWNQQSFAVAMAGNTDTRECNKKQYDRLVELCRVLCWVNGGLDLKGHDELVGGSKNPNKRCPGKYLPMNTLREKVLVCDYQPINPDPWRALELCGIVL